MSDVVGHYVRRDEDEDSQVWGQIDYRILRCRGCGAVYFQTGRVFSEDEEYRTNPNSGENESYLPVTIEYWPAPTKREKPGWSFALPSIDEDLSSLFEEIYMALNNDLRVLSAIGIRTAFDRASALLKVDPSATFAEKLTALVKLGRIGMSEQEALETITEAGSAAAHRGWQPTAIELDTMMNILEGFLHRTFLLNAEAEKLKKRVPTRRNRDVIQS